MTIITNLKMVVMTIGVVLMGVGFVYADLNDGLVAHWALDGDAIDSSGSSHGTIYGATTTGGQIDEALNFTGDDGVYIESSAGTGSDLNIYNTDMTISAWVNIRTGGTIVARAKPHYITYQLQASTRARINMYISPVHYRVDTAEILSPNTWYHIVGVFDRAANKGYIYVNGVRETEGPLPDAQPTNDGLTKIGCRNNTTDQAFNGIIDDVRIYDRALSVEEVEALYLESTHELTGLEIVGPGEVAENSQTPYKAIAYYDDDSTQDVTALVEWLVEPDNNCSIAAGVLTTEVIDLPEDVTITAQYGEGIEPAQKDVSLFMICPSGSALEFDGVDDYVDCGNDESLDMTDELTVSAWIKRSSFSTTGTVVGKNNGNSVTAGYGLFSYTQGVEFNFYSAGRWRRTTPRVAVTANQWHHVAGTFNGNIAYLYVDGEQKASLVYSGDITIAAGYPVQIGYWRSQKTEYFNGSMDEVTIYDRALSADEIRGLTHTSPDIDDPTLVAYWSFDEGEGDIAYDLSLSGNYGQLSSSEYCDPEDPACSDMYPTWTDDIPPVGICSVEGIVERNLSDVLNSKQSIKEQLNETMAQEEALREYMDIMFRDRNFGNTSKGDVAKAKQKIHSAIQHEEQAGTAIDQSVDKIYDAMKALGIE